MRWQIGPVEKDYVRYGLLDIFNRDPNLPVDEYRVTVRLEFEPEERRAINQYGISEKLIHASNDQIITIVRFLSQHEQVFTLPTQVAAYQFREALEKDFERTEKYLVRYIPQSPEPEPQPEPIVELPHFADKLRYEGMWIVGHRGAGKTQVLQTLIMRDLERMVRGEKLSLLLMDSQGVSSGDRENEPTILYLLTRLKLFAPGEPLHGKLIYLTPREPSIPLNLFDLGFPGSPGEKYVATQELITFILTGLMGDDFSPSMRRLFSRCIRVVLERPGATLADMVQLLIDPKPFGKEIARAGEKMVQWFEQVAKNSNAKVTRDAVLDRLDGLDMFPDFERMISAPKTEFNLLHELEAGKIIVVDTSSRSRMATATVGRFFIALLDTVSRARVDIMDSRRKTPAFIYIDELAAYCRDNANHLALILAECRKQNLAICAANQQVSQIYDTEVRDALLDSSIKLANAHERDAHTLAGNMGTTSSELLTNHPAGTFALHTRGMPKAILASIPYPNMRAMPLMSEDEYRQVRAEMLRGYRPSSTAVTIASVINKRPPRNAAEAQKQYDDAVKRTDWERASELKYGIIPRLSGPKPPMIDPDDPSDWTP